MILSDDAFVMLLVEPRFRDFTSRPVCDTATHTEAILAVSAGSREEVDRMVQAAAASGGTPAGAPVDHGFMYYASFRDLDGHHWEVLHMDSQAMQS